MKNMNREPLDLQVSLLLLKKIRDKCTDEILQYCLFESIHENNVIPALNYYHLRRTEQVQRLETLLQYKGLDTYIKVLENLTNTLTNILS